MDEVVGHAQLIPGRISTSLTTPDGLMALVEESYKNRSSKGAWESISGPSLVMRTCSSNLTLSCPRCLLASPSMLKPESTERRHVGSLLKKQKGTPLNLG